ncbi:MAG: polymerase subunit chi [Steroidobacteraceae bacterium]|nr:polymerase subunit chi [Steroidobacteraceae bacterium]
MPMPRVDFYVLASADPAARLRFACRLVEKAWLREHRVRVQLDPGGDGAAFDDLLWTFADRSFVPHERLAASGGPPGEAAPVVIAEGDDKGAGDRDMLVNLAGSVPAGYLGYARIAEVVDADDQRRKSGRDRFRFYREQGIEPQTHEMGDDS